MSLELLVGLAREKQVNITVGYSSVTGLWEGNVSSAAPGEECGFDKYPSFAFLAEHMREHLEEL